MKEQERPKLLIVGNLAKDIIFGEETFGGSAATIAIASKRLGLDVGIMSVIGRDEFSDGYMDYLEKFGIDTSMVYKNAETISVCEVNSSENKISSSLWFDNGCHEEMNKLAIPTKMGSYNLIHLVSSPPELSLRISENYDNLSYEPGPMLVSNESYFDPRVAKRSKLLFLNEEEHGAILALNKMESIQKKFSNLDAIVVTMGARGSKLLLKGGNEVYIEPCSLKGPIIDSIGAGDNYKAGFLSGYLNGESLESCATTGSKLGALCVQQKGGILPDEKVMEI